MALWFAKKKKIPLPLMQCVILDNCMQHSLMASLMADAQGALTLPGNLQEIFSLHFQTALWNRFYFPLLKVKSLRSERLENEDHTACEGQPWASCCISILPSFACGCPILCQCPFPNQPFPAPTSSLYFLLSALERTLLVYQKKGTIIKTHTNNILQCPEHLKTDECF